MFIDKVNLKNIRGFRDLDFSLVREGGRYAGWTVFTGDNGSGKSSLLKAIAIGLVGPEAARALQPSFNGWVKEGADESEIRLEIHRTIEDDDYLKNLGRLPLKNFPAIVRLKREGREPRLESWVEAPRPARLVPRMTIWSTDIAGWFSCGYGPFRRIYGMSALARQHMFAPVAEKYATLFHEAASLEPVDEWLRSLSHKALEERAEEKAQLDMLIALLNDDLMPNQITVDRVDSDGLWLVDRLGTPLTWSDMSDGYRSLLALLIDIVRHLASVFGIAGLISRNEQGALQIVRSGVVLIDEIDAHLHPEWQREIGFWLKRHFPNIQFLVTTHSPLICQAADDNGLFVLPEPGSAESPRALSKEEYRRIISSRPDTILLSEAFGLRNTRSPRAVDALAEYGKFAAKKQAGAKLSAGEDSKMRELESFVNLDETV